MASRDRWKAALTEFSFDHDVKLLHDEKTILTAVLSDSLLATWVKNNVCYETALTPEELLIWSSLRTEAEVNSINDIGSKVPTWDDENFAENARSLQEATAALKRQTEKLHTQADVFTESQRMSKRTSTTSSTSVSDLTALTTRKTQDIKLENTRELNACKEQLYHDIACLSQSSCDLKDTVAQLLQIHDLEFVRTTENSPISSATSTLALSDHRISTLNNALQRTLAESIKLRMDRVYLETLYSDQETANVSVDENDEPIAELHHSLCSLFAEVDDISNMRVSQQHRQPLSTCNEMIEQIQAQMYASFAEETCQQIIGLMDQLEQLTRRCKQLHSHTVAISSMADYLKAVSSESDMPVPSVMLTRIRNTLPNDPFRLREIFQRLGLGSVVTSPVARAQDERLYNQNISEILRIYNSLSTSTSHIQSILRKLELTNHGQGNALSEIMDVDEDIKERKLQIESYANARA